MSTFWEVVKKAEEDFKKFEGWKKKVKVLNDLNQGLPGTVEFRLFSLLALAVYLSQSHKNWFYLVSTTETFLS